jgi:hypothetical protein
VTVLAYAQGIEDFVDANGDGQYSCTNFVDPVSGKVPSTYRPLVDTCLSGGEAFTDMGDPFLDTGDQASLAGVTAAGTLDGKYESAKGDLPFPYGHPAYTAAGDGKWGLNYIRSSIEIVFSKSTAVLTRQVCTANSACRDWTAADGDPSKIAGVAGAGCSSQTLAFRLSDSNNNVLPSGTAIAVTDAYKLSLGSITPPSVPSTNIIGGTIHFATVKPDDNCSAGSFTLQINTPRGKSTPFTFSSQ